MLFTRCVLAPVAFIRAVYLCGVYLFIPISAALMYIYIYAAGWELIIRARLLLLRPGREWRARRLFSLVSLWRCKLRASFRQRAAKKRPNGDGNLRSNSGLNWSIIMYTRQMQPQSAARSLTWKRNRTAFGRKTWRLCDSALFKALIEGYAPQLTERERLCFSVCFSFSLIRSIYGNFIHRRTDHWSPKIVFSHTIVLLFADSFCFLIIHTRKT